MCPRSDLSWDETKARLCPGLKSQPGPMCSRPRFCWGHHTFSWDISGVKFTSRLINNFVRGFKKGLNALRIRFNSPNFADCNNLNFRFLTTPSSKLTPCHIRSHADHLDPDMMGWPRGHWHSGGPGRTEPRRETRTQIWPSVRGFSLCSTQKWQQASVSVCQCPLSGPAACLSCRSAFRQS